MRNVKYRPESENINALGYQWNKFTWFWDPCQCIKPVKQEMLSMPGMVSVNLVLKKIKLLAIKSQNTRKTII